MDTPTQDVPPPTAYELIDDWMEQASANLDTARYHFGNSPFDETAEGLGSALGVLHALSEIVGNLDRRLRTIEEGAK